MEKVDALRAYLMLEEGIEKKRHLKDVRRRKEGRIALLPWVEHGIEMILDASNNL